MLKNQFQKLNGLVSTWLQKKKQNQLQVIHSRDDHWIVASSVRCNSNEVLVYDSTYSTVDEKIISVIQNLFSSDNIRIKSNQKQSNGNDCGLFAIANATAIANGVDPCKIKLINHL